MNTLQTESLEPIAPTDQVEIKVLVVDDSAASRAQIRDALAKSGLAVVEAGEGREALWRAQAEEFQCVVTDLHMPTMDGFALTRELRQLPGFARVPILVVTSDCSRERIDRAREVGATAWLFKPLRLDLIAETVRRAVNNLG